MIAVVAALMGPHSLRADLVFEKLAIPPGVYIAGPSNPNASQIESALGLASGTLGGSLFKHDLEGIDPEEFSGSLVDSYTSTYVEKNATYDDYDTVTIVHVEGKPAASPLQILVVKDGTAGSYAWLLTGDISWDGEETLIIKNDFLIKPNTTIIQDISHVEIYAVVPEPSTVLAGALLLLPFGLGVARVIRRNRKALA